MLNATVQFRETVSRYCVIANDSFGQQQHLYSSDSYSFLKKKKNIHILGITESHANKYLLDDQVSVTDYTLVRKDRESGQGGGVCCYVTMILIGKGDLIWKSTELSVCGLKFLFGTRSLSCLALFTAHLIVPCTLIKTLL